MKRIRKAEIKYDDLQVTYEDGSTSSRGLSIFNGEPYIASQTLYTITVKQSGSNSYNEELTAIYDSNLQERRQGTYSPDRLKDIEETLLSEIERDNEYEASKQIKQESKPTSKQRNSTTDYYDSTNDSIPGPVETTLMVSESILDSIDKSMNKLGAAINATLEAITPKPIKALFSFFSNLIHTLFGLFFLLIIILIIIGVIANVLAFIFGWESPKDEIMEPIKQEKIIEQPKQKQGIKQEQSVQKQEPSARKVAYQPKLSDLDENQKALVPKLTTIIKTAHNISDERATRNAYLQLYYCDVNTELVTENERISDCMVQYKAAVEDGHVFED